MHAYSPVAKLIIIIIRVIIILQYVFDLSIQYYNITVSLTASVTIGQIVCSYALRV